MSEVVLNIHPKILNLKYFKIIVDRWLHQLFVRNPTWLYQHITSKSLCRNAGDQLSTEPFLMVHYYRLEPSFLLFLSLWSCTSTSSGFGPQYIIYMYTQLHSMRLKIVYLCPIQYFEILLGLFILSRIFLSDTRHTNKSNKSSPINRIHVVATLTQSKTQTVKKQVKSCCCT